MIYAFYSLFIFLCTTCICDVPLKVLHLTFHKGCANEIEALSQKLNFDLTTWYIHSLPPYFLDGYSSGSALYNIGHTRAKKIWDLHSEYFQKFDIILTSDTAPLARIFLQNQSTIPLIIWICDRFDYSDIASLDCEFPDTEYYNLLINGKNLPHVTIVANTPFEHVYALSRGVDTGSLIIKPSGFCDAEEGSSNPSNVDRENTFYIPHYHNETIFMNLSDHLTKLGIKNYCGRHNGLADLQAYKGIIHLPYSWSTIALFENIKIGIPYFIPSKKFLKKLIFQGLYWHQNAEFLLEKNQIELSEWYSNENRKLFIYFDSWEDLKEKIKSCNYTSKKDSIKSFAQTQQKKSLLLWQNLFKKMETE